MPPNSAKSHRSTILTQFRWVGWAASLLLFAGPVLGQPKQGPAHPYVVPIDIDRHALTAPAEAEQSVEKLAEYLAFPAKTEREKARAIFRWITDRISYDIDAEQTGSRGEVRVDRVLLSRQARCVGYTALFDALARRAGLQTATITGFVKGLPEFMKSEDVQESRPNHMWNAVRINGCWQLLDTMAASGYVRGQRFHKQFREQFFLMPPHEMILTHFPLDSRWQLLALPLTHEQFDALAPVDIGFVHVGILREFHLLDKMKQQQEDDPSGSSGPGNVYAAMGGVKVLNAPLERALMPGRDYYFTIEAPNATEMVLRNNDRWQKLRRVGTRFEGVIWPNPGEMTLFIQPHLGDQYQVVRSYTVFSTNRK